MSDEIKPPPVVTTTTATTTAPGTISTTTTSQAEAFHGLSGLWGKVANFGTIGVMFALLAWMMTIHVPAEQRASREELARERETSRTEADKSRQHGAEASKEIGAAIRDVGREFREVQATTQKNQERLIELQLKAMQK